MKKFIYNIFYKFIKSAFYFLVLGLSITNIEAQITIKQNYLFVADKFMYIDKEVNIENNTSFYLRNGSQILQGTANHNNSGSGVLSVYQEGTVNNFQYNYWCSPIGLPNSTIGNNNFGITRLFIPSTTTSSNPALILDYNYLNGISNPLSIAKRWIYTFSTANTYAQWNYIGDLNTITPGQGFTMKGTSGTDNLIVDMNDGIQNNPGNAQRYDFRGRPNNGIIQNNVSTDNFSLIGNPYPSAIDLNLFLLDSDNAGVINGQAYFWEQVPVNSHYINQYQGGYGIYTPITGYTPAAFWNFNGDGTYNSSIGTSGTAFERRFSPIGQGFMVKGTSNGVVRVKNTHRVFVKESQANLSEFAKNSSSKNSANTNTFFDDIPNVVGIDYTTINKGFAPQVRIYAKYNNQGIRPTTLAFHNLATDGFDYGFDGGFNSTEGAEFYYLLENSNDEYFVNVVQYNIDKKIPVGFRCNSQTNFKIKAIDFLYNLDTNLNIYIHDKFSNAYYDIKNDEFNLTLPASINNTQYEITFKNDSQLNNQEFEHEDITVFHDSNSEEINLINKELKNIVEFKIYDLNGKLLLFESFVGNNPYYKFSTTSYASSTYILIIKTDDGKITSLKIIK